MPPVTAPAYRIPRAQQWRENSTLSVNVEGPDERREYYTEREEEEYYYIQQRAPSEASQSATVNFLTDDRIEEDRSTTTAPPRAHFAEQRYPAGQPRRYRDMSTVDYSAQNFQQSRAAIDAAARNENVRVRQHGDTTVVTEHRDPYSFYWQLDQLRKQEEEPPRRRLPPADYVIEEEEIPQETLVLSPDSHDSGIHFESQYSRPHKEDRPLPSGWEKHEDPSGFSYYWHVDSGTIQREPPRVTPRKPSPPPSPEYEDSYVQTVPPAPAPEPPQPIIQQLPPPQPIIEEHAFKQTTTKRRVENEDESDEEVPIDGQERKSFRFIVRSLGWREVPEGDLTAERSAQAVNTVISELSSGSSAGAPKWADGRELILELDDNELRLIEQDTGHVVHAEKIQQIRVWGVGRDNGRDFAYVARDRNSRRFLCYVFRCDTPARTIANVLRDICKRLLVHTRPNSISTNAPSARTETRRIMREASFPTPIDEPKKVVRCHFLGVTQVPRATGIDVLNDAVDRLVTQVRPDRWILADVGIAPSAITINEVDGGQIAQCRVRYLSFLGIGQDIKHCAFIMQTSTENFMCYVFHVEPNAAAMAKTIEAACKLRYQKVLDAHVRHTPSH